jgi:hypothetical protein
MINIISYEQPLKIKVKIDSNLLSFFHSLVIVTFSNFVFEPYTYRKMNFRNKFDVFVQIFEIFV